MVCVLLSSGIFVVVIAIIRTVFTLSPNPSAININEWYIYLSLLLNLNSNVSAGVFERLWLV